MNTKVNKNVILGILLIVVGQPALSQGFVNMDFEHPILPLAPSYGEVLTSNAIPGWAAYFGGGRFEDIIFYDGISLGGSTVTLEDSNNIDPKPIQGNYSVLLFGASSIYAPPDEQFSSDVGQTGTIPTTAQSLTCYLGNSYGTLQVTFNGQPLALMDISNTLNYTIWAADISAYAGQIGQLLFTAPVNSSDLLDNIQFSSVPIPEPGVLALFGLGGLAFLWHRRKAKA